MTSLTSRAPPPCIAQTVAQAGTLAAISQTCASTYDPHVHPIVGSWLAATPRGPAHVVFAPCGDVIMAWPHSEDIEAGTFPYTTAARGAWRPTGETSLHLLVIEIISALGYADDYLTLESEIVVDDPGDTFHSELLQQATCRCRRHDPDALAEMTGLRMAPEG